MAEYNRANFRVINEMKNLVASCPYNMLDIDRFWNHDEESKF